jgi:hypothetical protein
VVHARGDEYLVYEDLQCDRGAAGADGGGKVPHGGLSGLLSDVFHLCRACGLSDNGASRGDYGAAELAVGGLVGGDGGDFVWVCELGLAVCAAFLYQCFKLEGEKVAIGPSNLLSCLVGARAMRIGPHD